MSSWYQQRVRALGPLPLVKKPRQPSINTVKQTSDAGIVTCENIPNKLKNIDYITPITNDTIVLMAFFNPAKSIRIQQNILYVKHMLDKASIPYCIGEIAFNNEPFFFSPSEHIFQLRSNSYMFYKENIINLLLSKDITKEFTKYILLDGDIIFTEPNWVDIISEALDTYDIVQPFQKANDLNSKFIIESTKNSIIDQEKGGHPGYVWAFRRDFYERVGLYEKAVIGSGDVCLCYRIGFYNLENIHPIYQTTIGERILDLKKASLPLEIWHLPHGIGKRKQYQSRKDKLQIIMKYHQIEDLQHIITKTEEGVLEWNEPIRSEFNKVVLEYFVNREDDNFEEIDDYI
jgi:hypothetical protein